MLNCNGGRDAPTTGVGPGEEAPASARIRTERVMVTDVTPALPHDAVPDEEPSSPRTVQSLTTNVLT